MLAPNLEGQILVGQLVHIDEHTLTVAVDTLQTLGPLTIPRPPAEQEVCRPVIGDRLALQVRDGTLLLRTMAQTRWPPGTRYAWGQPVEFTARYYDAALGLVAGTVDRTVPAYARLAGSVADFVVQCFYERTSQAPLQRLPLPATIVPVAVYDAVYWNGEWCLLTSSELYRRRANLLRTEDADLQWLRQLQYSYLFDYLEYQPELACRIAEVRSHQMFVAQVDRITPAGDAINRFPVRYSPGDLADPAAPLVLQHYGILRERGELGLTPPARPSASVRHDCHYLGMLWTSRAGEFCASLRVDSEDCRRWLPVLVSLPPALAAQPFGPLIPFLSFIAVKGVQWDPARQTWYGAVELAPAAALAPEVSSGWDWYYTAAGPQPLWALKPTAGIWSPLYPYNHLTGRMGLPVHNFPLAASCSDRYAAPSLWTTEVESSRYGHECRGTIVCSSGDTPQLFVQRRDAATPKIRAFNDRQQEQLFNLLRPGQVVTGTIASIQTYGLFVQLEGITGLIHKSEIEPRAEGVELAARFALGAPITARIVAIDPERRRLSLSIKQLGHDAWQEIDEAIVPGALLQARVPASDADWCLFVELGAGLLGSVPKAELPPGYAAAIAHTRDALIWANSGEITVSVVDLDRENRKLVLSACQLPPDPLAAVQQAYSVGSTVTARVTGVSAAGLTVALDGGVPGFIPSSQLGVILPDASTAFRAGEILQAEVTASAPWLPVLLSIQQWLASLPNKDRVDWKLTRLQRQP